MQLIVGTIRDLQTVAAELLAFVLFVMLGYRIVVIQIKKKF